MTALALVVRLAGGDAARAGPHLYALRYATSSYQEAYLIEGGLDRPVPFAWLFFLVADGRRRVLIDTGFRDPVQATRYGIGDLEPVERVLGRLGVKPGAITDVVLTHGHWDHAGGLALFPAATIWITGAELRAMQSLVTRTRPEAGHYLYRDLLRLLQLRRAGRLRLLDREMTLFGWLRLVRVGGHTPGSLAVVLMQGGPRVVLAADNAYLYRNLQGVHPISTAARTGADALPQIRRLAGRTAIIVPGHEPQIFRRFPRVAAGVVRIYP